MKLTLEQGKKRFENEINNALRRDHMLVTLEDEEVIGFSWSQIHESKEGKKIDKVIMLLISPDRYGIGISGQLMEKEREYAKEYGVDVLDIETG
ncbi:MAG: GNAT family N-acetyltransferase [Thermoplasmata archaeon]